VKMDQLNSSTRRRWRRRGSRLTILEVDPGAAIP
jgi:hypothetical protein